MKKTLIGAVLALIGSIWAGVIILAAGNNLVDTWSTETGRFWSTMIDRQLLFLIILAPLLTLFGIVVLLFELFRKN